MSDEHGFGDPHHDRENEQGHQRDPHAWRPDAPGAREFGGSGSEPVAKVRVTVPAGRVDVVARESGEGVRVEVLDVEGPPLEVTHRGEQLTIDHYKDADGQIWSTVRTMFSGSLPDAFGGMFGNSDSGPSPRVRLALSVPADTRVSLRTLSADVFVSGLRRPVSVTTASGDVTLDDLDSVDVNVGSGEVEAAAMSGEIAVRSVSGRVTIHDSSPRTVRLSAASGATLIDLRPGSSLVTASSVSGDVTVRLPASAGFDATTATVSGQVVIDGRTVTDERGRRGGHRFAGTREVAIKARTVSGNVVVLREQDGSGPVIGEPNPSDVQDVRGDHGSDTPSGTAHDGMHDAAHDDSPDGARDDRRDAGWGI